MKPNSIRNKFNMKSIESPKGIKSVKSIIAVVVALVVVILPVLSSGNIVSAANYDAEYRINRELQIVGGSSFNIRTIHSYYDENEYVSLRDMAAALSGTNAAFNVSISSNSITFNSGASYEKLGVENESFTGKTRAQSEPEYVRKRNSFNLNGRNCYYYTFIYEIEDGIYDCYMYLTDLILILEKDAWVQSGVLHIDPDTKLTLNLKELEAQDFFSGTNSVLVGDVTTGEVYYSYKADDAVAIASTTKLMTYLVVMNEVSAENISLKDNVVFSENVNKLSYAVDGVIRMAEDGSATVQDLLAAMLLPSSNESALALAEHISGSEANFVRKMNSTASSIGLSEATRFYNCNGLPTYTDGAFESKIQNRMSANDMFMLVSHIVTNYPQIVDITSKTALTLSSLNRTVYNTNALLHNETGVVGLKTGTTNKAGCCLVSAVQVEASDGVHTLVSVEFGAEDVITRNCISKTLLMYAKQVFAAGGVSSIEDYDASAYMNDSLENLGIAVGEIPDNPDDLANLVIWTARSYLGVPEANNVEVPEGEHGY